MASPDLPQLPPPLALSLVRWRVYGIFYLCCKVRRCDSLGFAVVGSAWFRVRWAWYVLSPASLINVAY